MPLTKCIINSTETNSPTANTVRNRANQTQRKAPGTRAGVFMDWRQGSTRGKTSGRSGKTLRDGR